MSSYLTICEEAARAAGQVLQQWQGRFSVQEKGQADLVTDADYAAQTTIRRILLGAFPKFNFLGEEAQGVESDATDSPFCWIVDPLDGTTNYIHGLPNYCVSIALEEAGQVIAGVVYDPVFDRCFKAEKGSGAWMNGKRLQVASAAALEDALIAASFPPQISKESAEIEHFIDVLTEARGIRRLGSAALNLAYVAAGNLDGYWARSNKVWDVAAGVILVEEAGGVVQGYGSQPFDLDNPTIIATGTPELQAAIQARVGQA